MLNKGNDESEEGSANKRLSRSQTFIGLPEKGREQVLPNVCIICRKTKYKVDHEKKRNLEKLKKVETFTAGSAKIYNTSANNKIQKF